MAQSGETSDISIRCTSARMATHGLQVNSVTLSASCTGPSHAVSRTEATTFGRPGEQHEGRSGKMSTCRALARFRNSPWLRQARASGQLQAEADAVLGLLLAGPGALGGGAPAQVAASEAQLSESWSEVDLARQQVGVPTTQLQEDWHTVSLGLAEQQQKLSLNDLAEPLGSRGIARGKCCICLDGQDFDL
mmetsp:Transcript_1526/g.6057  ORF Transcript_1526/g.6057 Transcript_1526/m.6057 type:complete len:191 (-) Transcript_1526:1136-1708(-)